MALRLHHTNVCSDDMGKLRWFYGDVLDLTRLPQPPMVGTTETDQDGSQEWGDSAAFFTAGHETELQIHATLRRPYAGHQHKHSINPLANGHFCFRTDTMDDILTRLDHHNIPYSDYGYWAIQGWRQVFLSDPAGNIIEIHQVDKGW
ncbi:VOC family protein [Nocardiopsis salina]|uniref:VOC family protein n=1 Tax=Nocardiopsis salina TaxID=245836 RepID=UPI000348BFD2|nr:VOC family protein [Nocardiopsis salina]